jgi:hypothetical protein
MLQNRLPATVADEATLPPPTVPAPTVVTSTIAAPSRNGKSPSPHGDNGESVTTSAGRDANGRFARAIPAGQAIRLRAEWPPCARRRWRQSRPQK